MHPNRLVLKSAFVISVVALSLWAHPVAVLCEKIEASPLDVTLVVKKPGNSKPLDLKDEKIELIYQKVSFKEGDRIEKLLRGNGILPDIEAITIIYAKNPSANSSSFRPGAELMLPAVKGDHGLQQALAEGYLVELTLDKKLKEDFLNEVEALQGLVKPFSDLQPAYFRSEDSQRKMVASVNIGVDVLGSFRTVIRDKTWPISSDMIRHLLGEARLLKSILQRVVEPKGKLVAEAEAQIELIAEDLQVRAEMFKEKRGPGEPPPRYRDMRVKVTTLSAQTGTPVHNLYVYYVPVALKRKPESVRFFDRVSSPADHLLVEANYFVWAGQPGDLTPQPHGKIVEVRKNDHGQEQLVELVIP